MTSQRTPRITVYGNLGADPEIRILKGRTVTKELYDFIKDEAVTEVHTTPDRQIRTASLAVNGRDEHDEEITRWHRLVDFEEHLADCQKGDRLKVTGYFRDRTYKKDGEEKTIRELIVASAEIQPKRVPAETETEAEAEAHAA